MFIWILNHLLHHISDAINNSIKAIGAHWPGNSEIYIILSAIIYHWKMIQF